jgi:hypothetical protein
MIKMTMTPVRIADSFTTPWVVQIPSYKIPALIGEDRVARS